MSEIYPGKSRIILEFTTSFILEYQELSWNKSKIYPGNARIILESTTSFILEYQELSRYVHNMFSPGISEIILEITRVLSWVNKIYPEK